MTSIFSSDLATLVSHWNGNAYYPEQAITYIASIGEVRASRVKLEIEQIVDHAYDIRSDVRNATAFEFDNREKTISFILAVKNYIFNDGHIPEIDSYLE